MKLLWEFAIIITWSIYYRKSIFSCGVNKSGKSPLLWNEIDNCIWSSTLLRVCTRVRVCVDLNFGSLSRSRMSRWSHIDVLVRLYMFPLYCLLINHRRRDNCSEDLVPFVFECLVCTRQREREREAVVSCTDVAPPLFGSLRLINWRASNRPKAIARNPSVRSPGDNQQV